MVEIDDEVECTCLDTCDLNCKGECGCIACHNSYQYFLSCDQ